jgi:hypothetical protein
VKREKVGPGVGHIPYYTNSFQNLDCRQIVGTGENGFFIYFKEKCRTLITLRCDMKKPSGSRRIDTINDLVLPDRHKWSNMIHNAELIVDLHIISIYLSQVVPSYARVQC